MGQRRNRQREAFHKEQARSAEQGQPEEEQEVAEERLRSGKILRRIATSEDILNRLASQCMNSVDANDRMAILK